MAPNPSTDLVTAKEKSVSLLDKSQVHKASEALLKNISKPKSSEQTKNLLEVGNEDSPLTAVPVWLILNTKKHIVDKNRLKPGKILLPHSLNRPGSSICLITADPQRAFKDLIEEETFPAALRAQIRILGLEKLKQRYKSFEQKRQLVAEYDVLLADERIVPNLPTLLGKAAFQSSKRPVPVDLTPSNEHTEKRVIGKKTKKDVSQRKTPSAAAAANRIANALSSARVHLAPSATTSIHIGYSHFTPEQLDDNINAVVDGMVDKFVPKGWKNIKSLFIKGPESAALPIWQTSELWTEEEDVLEDKDAEAIKSSTGKRKRHDDKEIPSKKAKMLGVESGFNPEMAARREALRKAKRAAADPPEDKPKTSKKVKITEKKEISSGKVKSKTIKSKVIATTA